MIEEASTGNGRLQWMLTIVMMAFVCLGMLAALSFVLPNTLWPHQSCTIMQNERKAVLKSYMSGYKMSLANNVTYLETTDTGVDYLKDANVTQRNDSMDDQEMFLQHGVRHKDQTTFFTHNFMLLHKAKFELENSILVRDMKGYTGSIVAFKQEVWYLHEVVYRYDSNLKLVKNESHIPFPTDVIETKSSGDILLSCMTFTYAKRAGYITKPGVYVMDKHRYTLSKAIVSHSIVSIVEYEGVVYALERNHKTEVHKLQYSKHLGWISIGSVSLKFSKRWDKNFGTRLWVWNDQFYFSELRNIVSFFLNGTEQYTRMPNVHVMRLSGIDKDGTFIVTARMEGKLQLFSTQDQNWTDVSLPELNQVHSYPIEVQFAENSTMWLLKRNVKYGDNIFLDKILLYL